MTEGVYKKCVKIKMKRKSKWFKCRFVRITVKQRVVKRFFVVTYVVWKRHKRTKGTLRSYAYTYTVVFYIRE